ncbi:MAG: class I SAM-dependent methyltransferase [Cytophagia bacterium]|jgi:SAM-dependent methyltransferase|nr:class I SAM-dependent methyltransferase [Cytophagia bacterium]
MENNYHCNACNSNISEFLPYGKRINALCPNCGSLERHRFFKYWLDVNKNILNPKTRILHFAPEKAITAHFKKCCEKNYISVDVVPNRAMKVEDITKLTFSANSFDFILCSHVLHHVNEDEKAISELYRVLDKNGIMVLMGSHGQKITRAGMSINSEGEEYFMRHYNTENLMNKLSVAGFLVDILRFEDLINNDKELFKLGIKKGDVLFTCTKLY